MIHFKFPIRILTKKAWFFFVLFVVLTPCLCKAQDSIPKRDTIIYYDIFERLTEPSSGKGKVVLAGDNIKSIISENKHLKKQIKGFRIRIFRDNSQTARHKAENIKTNIEKQYPGVPVYVTHHSPDFHVEVGDFRNHDEAEKLKRTLLSSYPAATLVNVSINFPPL